MAIEPARSYRPTTLELRPWRRRATVATSTRVAVETGLWLTVIVALSSLLRIWAGAATGAPWIIPDELIYSELARSFAETGAFAVRDQAFSVWTFGPLYPVLISPIFALVADPPAAYAIVKAFNAVLISSAAVPAYFLGRRVLSRPDALVAAALTVAVPSAVYSTKLMTESLAYPVFLWAMIALVRALDRPSPGRLTLLAAAVGVAALTRAQMIALVGAFALAYLVLAAGDRRRRRLAVGLACGLAVAGAVLVTLGAVGGREFRVGALLPLDVARSTLQHVALVDLYVGVMPLLALFALLTVRSAPRKLRLHVVATASVLLCLSVVSAIYLESLPGEVSQQARVYDRYVFYAAPLLFICLLAWLRGIGSTSRRVTILAACIVGALPLVLPYSELLTGREWGVSSSTVALVPWVAIGTMVGTGPLLAGIVAAVAGSLAFLAVRLRPTAPTLALGCVVGVVVLTGAVAQIANVGVSSTAVRIGVAEKADWVDRAVGGEADVVAIWSGSPSRTWRGYWPIWQADLFNRSVGRVYHVRTAMPYAPPGSRLRVRGGALLLQTGAPLTAGFVLTDETMALVGTRVASDKKTGMVLVRVGGPVRLRAGA